MELNAQLFKALFEESCRLFYRYFFLWLVLLLPATLPSIILNTLAWHEEAIGQYIISTTSLETFKLLDNFSYVLILAGIWVYWLALVLTLRDIERSRPVNVAGSFADGVKMIPADFCLKCAAAWKTLLWGLCFIVPGLYKAVLYSLAKYSLIEENKKGFDALNASHSLLKGRFVHYLDYILFVFLIVFYVFMVQKLLMDHVYNFFMFREMSGALRWIENFEIVCAGLAHVFIVIFFHRLYLRLKNAA